MMKLKILGVILLVFMGFSGVSQSATFKAGAAIRVVTPDPLIAVSGGVGAPKPVKEKNGDLYVRALVFEKGNERVAIVSIDNLGWPAILGDRSRKLIKGIAPENILIGATHTHSAPDAYGFPDANGKVGVDLEYLDWCVVQIADAVNEALKNLEPADLKINAGEAKGKIAYNYYAPQLYDPRCGVIQAIASQGPNKGKPIVTLVNYAIHPEVIGASRGILSPDLCGPLYSRIETKVGGVALFMNGAQGGMVTADNRLEDGKEANDWTECKRIGELLADEALRIIAPAKLQQNPSLFCTSKLIDFPVESEILKFVLNNSPLNFMATAQNDTVSSRINLLNVGTAQILTIPGEALPNIGYFLKRKMPTEHPFLFGLTNDAYGYILTKFDFNSFKSYEYITRTSLGEKTGEIHTKEALMLIDASPKPMKLD